MSEPEEDQAVQNLERSAVSVKRLRRAVESQQLRLDPAAGEQIRVALEDQMSKVDSWVSRAGGLTVNAPLGENPVAEAMATKFANRAEGTGRSFNDALRKYREVLEEARDAINAAMRTYERADEYAADSFRKIADDAFQRPV
ncbi:hypothetical protein SAMN02982929_06295 [Saccharopolyspora kobensis]|uniref:Excreted virulence factor EspC (Type VII ESX diderm) n=1 Tax=Saccharopolyspora kobensis TaxID=146035 RepID=A0A1H6EGZ6_9PSEU|nr:hypothetical protein [Saccharopolyspora kobensis]SEG96075.1 hypothetical protein SAMN02982929_06295 [Saccharopolyspora kobensis]SFD22483.1 hypothetical protein SAMN05216506_103131 [Saccharopolyspora kobensis]